MSEAVTIIIPHYRAEVLHDCLTSLYAHSDHPIEVLVIDDGGNAPSLQRARADFPQIEILRNERNLGFTGSCNRGLEAAQTRYAILLNDDTRVEPDWLGPLVALADSDPQIAACQPKLRSATEPELFDYGGGAGGYIDALGYTFCRGRLFDSRERDEGQEPPSSHGRSSSRFSASSLSRRSGCSSGRYSRRARWNGSRGGSFRSRPARPCRGRWQTGCWSRPFPRRWRA